MTDDAAWALAQRVPLPEGLNCRALHAEGRFPRQTRCASTVQQHAQRSDEAERLI